ncbi:MAG: 2-oxo-4-hydroxy-4-carboxy-5-ureidoimidazoline decarboxylase [Gammaproteobacteria bacterium]|nr:2-oxo-4-hydroxy-4-carboxy-5-ureidoimidazoline decarboxylase [Gammaproteobacteria bacterium]
MSAEAPGSGLDFDTLDHNDFVTRFGDIFEHSPWIAARTFERRPFLSADVLFAALVDTLNDAPHTERLALLRAHPELAGKVARAGELTENSTHEQSGAGLDRLSDEEYARFARLNAAYRQKFDFPFIIAARHHDKASILQNFERRLGNTVDEEFDTALGEVCKIARLRFDAIVGQ